MRMMCVVSRILECLFGERLYEGRWDRYSQRYSHLARGEKAALKIERDGIADQDMHVERVRVVTAPINVCLEDADAVQS